MEYTKARPKVYPVTMITAPRSTPVVCEAMIATWGCFSRRLPFANKRELQKAITAACIPCVNRDTNIEGGLKNRSPKKEPNPPMIKAATGLPIKIAPVQMAASQKYRWPPGTVMLKVDSAMVSAINTAESVRVLTEIAFLDIFIYDTSFFIFKRV